MMEVLRHAQHEAPDFGTVVVRFSRRTGLGFGLLFGVIAGPWFARSVWTGDVGQAVFACALVLPAFGFLVGGVRARPYLLIDPTGLTFCRAKIHVTWSEVAAVTLQEWQATYGLKHRLVVRAVHPERFDAMWQGVRPGFGVSKPRGGRISLLLDLLTPSSSQIAHAIRQCSGGTFAPEVGRVGRRPFRDPELDA